jgi:hypothetical protein
VVGLEDDDERRRAGIEACPDLLVVLVRRERVEQRHLAAGLDAGRADVLLPADARPPVGVRKPPDPEAGSDVGYRQIGSEAGVGAKPPALASGAAARARTDRPTMSAGASMSTASKTNPGRLE